MIRSLAGCACPPRHRHHGACVRGGDALPERVAERRGLADADPDDLGIRQHTPSPTATPEADVQPGAAETTDPRVVGATAVADIASKAARDLHGDEAPQRSASTSCPAMADRAQRDAVHAPFTPSEDRSATAARRWSRVDQWVIGPGEQGEPAGTISLGWDRCCRKRRWSGARTSRAWRRVLAFDLQLLAGNDLLTFDGGGTAELRVEVP